MAHLSKRLFIVLLIALFVVFSLSCNRKNGNTTNPTPEATEDAAKGENEEEPVVDTKEEEPEVAESTPSTMEGEITGEDTKEIPIYGVNEDTMEREAIVAHVSKEEKVTPRLVVDEVIENFQEEIGISDVVQEGERIIVSFKEGKAPMARVSSKMENVILECIACSLLDNVEDCTEVVYQGENGNQYESGHNLFELDEVYLSE